MTGPSDRTHPDAPGRAGPHAVVGWTHSPLPHGIELTLQAAASSFALENQQIAETRLVLTRNQALLLARFLLQVSGHDATDVADARPLWARWFRRR